MTDDLGPTTGDAILLLLEHAQDRANEAALAAPLDLHFADLSLGIAAARQQTLVFSSPQSTGTESCEELELLDSLERAEQLARNLPIHTGLGTAASDLVIALCDLIREARANA